VQSNVPPGTDQEPAQSSSSNSLTKNETVNYEISRTVSKIVEPVGVIKKLSVAVLVDGTYEAAQAGAGTSADSAVAESAKKYAPRSEEDLKRIEDIVKKAMGFSDERQDQVQVVNVQFGLGPDDQPTAATEAVSDGPNPLLPYLRYGVGALLFFMILMFVVRPLLAMLGTTGRPEAEAEAGGATPPPVPAVANAGIAAIPDRAQIIDMARKNPDTTAVVVKQWLKSSSGSA
jgi:flagellar M-ring protein FliF